MKECTCREPKTVADPRKQRFCRVCGNFLSRSSEEIGRLHTRMDASIASLELEEVELRQFIRKMNETLPIDIKHKYDTWRYNRRVEVRKHAA